MSEVLLLGQLMLNRAFAYDPAGQQSLAGLAGKTIVLVVKEPSLLLALSVEQNGSVTLSLDEPSHSDARVEGTATDLLAVLRAKDRTAAMMAHEIKIQGDTRTFFTLQAVMSSLDIDWEMFLGDQIGDLPAHWIADGLRWFAKSLRHQLRSANRTATNFVREENDWLVKRPQWQNHLAQVQHAVQGLDRLNAKVQRVKRQLAARSEDRPA